MKIKKQSLGILGLVWLYMMMYHSGTKKTYNSFVEVVSF